MLMPNGCHDFRKPQEASQVSIVERLRMYPVHRILAAGCALGLAPAALALAIAHGESQSVPVALGLFLMGVVATLRPIVLLPLRKAVSDPEAVRAHARALEEATIGPSNVLTNVFSLGVLLSFIGSVLTLFPYLRP